MVGRRADSEAAAKVALADGERTGDRFTIGYALHALAFGRMRDRDHTGAIAYCRQALDALGDDLETTDLRLLLMANYAAALNDVDRLAEAREALSQAVRLAEQAASARQSTVRLQGASMLFEWGAWDDALAELDDLHPATADYQVVQLISTFAITRLGPPRVGWPRGVSPRGSHRTERDGRPSLRSSHPAIQASRIHAQCANSRGARCTTPFHHALARR